MTPPLPPPLLCPSLPYPTFTSTSKSSSHPPTTYYGRRSSCLFFGVLVCWVSSTAQIDALLRRSKLLLLSPKPLALLQLLRLDPPLLLASIPNIRNGFGRMNYYLLGSCNHCRRMFSLPSPVSIPLMMPGKLWRRHLALCPTLTSSSSPCRFTI